MSPPPVQGRDSDVHEALDVIFALTRNRQVAKAKAMALDLKNFHAGSHAASIFPILVATQAQVADDAWQPASPDGVRPPYRCNARHLRRALLEGVAQSSGREIDADAWGSSLYQPTPTIIEAARALYARHSVEAISRHDAGVRNLRLTSVAVEEIIERARGNSEKAIVFVTGVPGAGKTLVGLNVATFTTSEMRASGRRTAPTITSSSSTRRSARGRRRRRPISCVDGRSLRTSTGRNRSS